MVQCLFQLYYWSTWNDDCRIESAEIRYTGSYRSKMQAISGSSEAEVLKDLVLPTES